MKRALAERAKLSVVAASRDLPSDAGKTSERHFVEGNNAEAIPVTSSNTLSPNSHKDPEEIRTDAKQHLELAQPPPQKIAKLTISSSATSTTPSINAMIIPEQAPSSSSPRQQPPKPSEPPTTTTSSSVVPPTSRGGGGAGHKRPRDHSSSSLQPHDASSSSSEPSAFYLQHQNRALAVELQSLRHSLKHLEREREQRRHECYTATQALHSLQATWTSLETALTIVPPTTPSTSSSSPPGLHTFATNSPSSTSAPKNTELESHTNSHKDKEMNHPSNNTNEVSPFIPSTSSTTIGNDSPSASPSSSVEWTTALSQALAGLGGLPSGAEHDIDWSSRCAANLSSRAAILQEQLWKRMTAVDSQDHPRDDSAAPSPATAAAIAIVSSDSVSDSKHGTSTLNVLLEHAEKTKQFEELQGELQLLRTQLEELQCSRTAAISSERKVRRNVYRLSAGMITMDQLLSAVQDDNEAAVDAKFQRELVQQKLLLEQQPHQQPQPDGQGVMSDAAGSSSAPSHVDGSAVAPVLSSAQVEALQARIADIEQSVKGRDDAIEELTKQIGDKERRITELLATQRSEKDVQKLQAWESISKQLQLAELSRKDLEEKLVETREKWSRSLGDRDVAVQNLDEQHQKFNKRWAELLNALMPGRATGSDSGDTNTDIVDDDLTALLASQTEAQAKETVELQHKLSQALENVRQAEATRLALRDALSMNESLQAKVEEFKSKYNSLRNAAANPTAAPARQSSASLETPAAPPPAAAASAAAPSSSSTGKDGVSAPPKDATTSNHSAAATNSSVPSDKSDKLHREHRRMRKEIAAMAASKEAAKAKLEKVEKERDSLVESNTRLLKQMTEKDEMNAKSLSTILHLKSMTEELMLERDNLEMQAKSASQLALTARLASNAKDRVSEEVVKEKMELESKVGELERSLATSKAKLESVTVEFSSANGKTAALRSEYENVLQRCNELIAELEKKNSEIRSLTEAVGKAERETREVAAKLQKLMKRPGPEESVSATTSIFTVDQLNTQISVLKNRLACPVCHYRDKECIIMRCRHMHCKQCVEERITNRSRKCPTCNVKFSEKDVEDIWLN